MQGIMKRIGILGSMFDPPHWGHFLVSEQVLEKGPGLDEVWLMPAHSHPFNKKSLPAHHRLEMTKFLEAQGMKLAKDEVVRKGVSYTIDTVRTLTQKHPHEFWWIIGSDNLEDISKWRKSEELIQKVPFIVFPRPGYPITHAPSSFHIVKKEHVIVSGVSSTDIRNRVAKGKSIRGLVPDGVAEYIARNDLYKST
jgi:nicotinate-nucleotide adenylyltransferase